MRSIASGSARHAAVIAAGLALVGSHAGSAHAQSVSGELVFLNWETGSAFEILKDLEDAFVAKHPEIKFRNINLTVQGDARGALRTALLGGEAADLLTNTWPAFRKELVEARMLRPLDKPWDAGRWGDNIPDRWRQFGQFDGVTYGVTYTYGDRSGIFYRPDTLKKAGLDGPPATWSDFTSSFAKLNAIAVTPIAIPAKVWAQTEWFETLLIRLGGVEAATRLAQHDMRWTDPLVKTALKRYAELIRAKCCGDGSTMLATDWDDAADRVLKAKTAGYELIGMWVNAIARTDYGLKEGTDYRLFQFPSLGAGHDDATIVDTEEFEALTSGKNPAAADAYLAFLGTAEAADIIARHGLASTSRRVDASLYGPVIKQSVDAVENAKAQFVFGDLLPGDLVDEYRVQLQKFVSDPSDATIDAVTAALEAKAADMH